MRSRGRPRVPWGQDPRASVGIPLRWQLDTRRVWGHLSELRRTGRAWDELVADGLPTDRSALASIGRSDPAASAEAVAWQTGGTLSVDPFTVDELASTGGLAFELARFQGPLSGVGIIEKIQTFWRLQRVEEGGTFSELYVEGPGSTPVPPLGAASTTLGLVRLYVLTCEAAPPAVPSVTGRQNPLVIPPASLGGHPYSWADARYATAQILGHNQRIVVPRRSVVRLWGVLFRDSSTPAAPGLFVSTLQGFLAGFNVSAGPTDAAYTTATLRGT